MSDSLQHSRRLAYCPNCSRPANGRTVAPGEVLDNPYCNTCRPFVARPDAPLPPPEPEPEETQSMNACHCGSEEFDVVLTGTVYRNAYGDSETPGEPGTGMIYIDYNTVDEDISVEDIRCRNCDERWDGDWEWN